MDLHFYRDSMNQYGVTATLYHAAYRAANQVTRIAVWNALVLTPDRVDERFMHHRNGANGATGAEGRLLDAGAMRPYARRFETYMSNAFINEAVAKGDRCYAFFKSDELMSFSWYSTHPTRLSEVSSNLVLRFDPSYAYMYNAYTAPPYRGRRLHAIGMAAALQAYAKEGREGLLSYVDSSNFASLKSCYRMGYQTFGRMVLMKIGRQFVCRMTPGCKTYGFHVNQSAD